MPSYEIKVNGNTHTVEATEDMPLLWVLRDLLQLKGTKYGCGIAQCGACTINIDGEAIRSCSYPISQVEEKEVTTIEGFYAESPSHPLLEAWRKYDVPQCGFCQAGQIMNAKAMLSKGKVTEADLDKNPGNICRCGSYLRIKKAIVAASQS